VITLSGKGSSPRVSASNSGLAVNMSNMAGHDVGTTGLVLGEKPENAL